MANYQLDEIIFQEGGKSRGYIQSLNEGYKMPATLIKGEKEGKTVILTGGIHGTEAPGIQTAMELAQEIDPKDVSGEILIFHPVNIRACLENICFCMPQDGKNLGGEFPGNPNGTFTEKIAYQLMGLFEKADFYIDMHGGDVHEDVEPFIFYPGETSSQEVSDIQREAASYMDVKYMVKSVAKCGTYNNAALRGTPCFMVEHGGRGLWSHEEVEHYKRNIKNVMRYLEVLSGEAVKPENPPIDITAGDYIYTEVAGCWYPEVLKNERIEKGQLIGTVKDFFGETIQEHRAKFSGVVLYLTSSLGVREGNPLIAYGEI